MNRQELLLGGASGVELPSCVRKQLMRRALGLDDLGSDWTSSDNASHLHRKALRKLGAWSGIFDRRTSF